MPIKIVSPKHLIKEAAAGPPQLLYNGGPLLANVDIVSIYWGSAWATNPLMASLEEFFNFVPTSSLIGELQEYNVPGFTIGPGQHSGCVMLTADPGSAVDDSQIRSELQAVIANGMVKDPTANTLYVFLLPSGTTVTDQGASSCSQFCGYHDALGNDSFGGPFYAVLPYQDCQACEGLTGTVLDSSTVVLWHEIAEAITDPVPGLGWYDNANGEIGDICEGGTKTINTAGVNRQSAPAAASYTSPGPSTDANGVITIALTPAAAPPPPPPPASQSWIVQLLWSNSLQGCV